MDPRASTEYGGVEQVVDMLCAALTRRGHDVTLFAAPGTRSEADVRPVLEDAHPDEMQLAIYSPTTSLRRSTPSTRPP